jgi:hypothetical protein
MQLMQDNNSPGLVLVFVHLGNLLQLLQLKKMLSMSRVRELAGGSPGGQNKNQVGKAPTPGVAWHSCQSKSQKGGDIWREGKREKGICSG